jgi:hypothetical protein
VIGLLVLLAALGSHADDATLSARLDGARIGTYLAFAGAVAGLAIAARALTRRVRRKETEERLAEVLREIDDDLEEKDGR